MSDNNEIYKKILKNQFFQSQYDEILWQSVVQSIPNIAPQTKENVEILWQNMLMYASILAYSEEFSSLDSALRIAQHSLISSNDPNSPFSLSGAVVLDKLTNNPAIKLSIQRNLLDSEYKDSLPLIFQTESIRRQLDHEIETRSGKVIYLNRFQKEVYEKTQSSEYVSISAPTSSGKSFIMSTLVLQELQNESPVSIVYIVPTRALVTEVENVFNEMIKENDLENVTISTVPSRLASHSNRNRLFVFTPERLHWFNTENPAFKIQLLIVDEAQKIADGSRGILLQQKIEEMSFADPELKIYFSSPYTENPDVLLNYLPITGKKSPVRTEYVAVNQNLLYVNQVRGKTTEWNVTLCTSKKSVDLGVVTLPVRPINNRKRFNLPVFALANPNGGNLIYANGAFDAEEKAIHLVSMISEDEQQDPEVNALIKLIKDIIHPRYRLVHVLSKGVAFHYGNMPLIIRQEIERLFKIGKIKYLVCTSTLLEGVNLPANSLFIKNPKRGAKTPMSQADFWNLAGRVGRLGHEFQGNIYCIEPDKWDIKPSPERTRLTITPAIKEIRDGGADLIGYIRQNTPISMSVYNPVLESAFSYYYLLFKRGQLRAGNYLTQEDYKLINDELIRIDSTIDLPLSLIQRNPGISPISMQALLNYFKLYEKELIELIPELPESDNSVDSYLGLINRLNQFLIGESPKLAFSRAILVVEWMKGKSLSELINKNLKYWERRAKETNSKPKKLEAVIRETMRDVDEYVRFKFAKFSACYIDILKFYLSSIGREDLENKIPVLKIWLEFGVSQGTQLSLIDIGLSRNAAIMISEFIPNDNFSREECVNWLTNNDLLALGLPQIILNEVTSILSKPSNTTQIHL